MSAGAGCSGWAVWAGCSGWAASCAGSAAGCGSSLKSRTGVSGAVAVGMSLTLAMRLRRPRLGLLSLAEAVLSLASAAISSFCFCALSSSFAMGVASLPPLVSFEFDFVFFDLPAVSPCAFTSSFSFLSFSFVSAVFAFGGRPGRRFGFSAVSLSVAVLPSWPLLLLAGSAFLASSFLARPRFLLAGCAGAWAASCSAMASMMPNSRLSRAAESTFLSPNDLASSLSWSSGMDCKSSSLYIKMCL